MLYLGLRNQEREVQQKSSEMFRGLEHVRKETEGSKTTGVEGQV